MQRQRAGEPAGALVRLGGSLALAAALVASWRLAGPGAALFDPRALRAAGALARSLFPPDLSPGFLALVVEACARTAGIAVAGTALALLAGLPLGALATPGLWRRGPLFEGEPRSAGRALGAAASLAAGALLRLLRAVPDLVWALLFVVAFGLGPLPGALALAVNSAGVVGRAAADLFEATPPRPLQALHASGAGRGQIFAAAVWPQAAPQLAGFALYQLECCMRAAAVLGFVGAGGVGHQIQLSMRMFEYGQVLTLLLALWLLLLLTEQASARLRRRWQALAPLPDLSGPLLTPARALRAGAWLALLGLSFAAAGFGELPGGAPGLLARTGRFAAGMFPPDLSPRFLASLARPLLETLAISVAGTLIGVALGALLGLPATATLALDPPLEPGRRSPAGRALRVAAFAGARALLALLRAIPELVWALLCIAAAGLGPASGALALGLHTGGVLGKLYAETLEDAPPRPGEALRASGASRLQILLFAGWPLCREQLAAWTLLRWEANLRVSTIVGMVGGGGLGLVLFNQIQLGFHERAATVVTLIWLLVGATDALADRVRADAGGGAPGGGGVGRGRELIL